MGYSITVTVKDVEDAKRLANMLAEIVEGATGKKSTIHIYDKTKALKKQEQDKSNINRKLLR